MTSWRKYILAGLLLGAAFCRSDSTPGRSLTTAEYRAELDGLLATTQQLDTSGASTPDALQHLPQSWPVHTEQRDFQISTEGLQREVRRYDSDKNLANAHAIRMRLEDPPTRARSTASTKRHPTFPLVATRLTPFLLVPSSATSTARPGRTA